MITKEFLEEEWIPKLIQTISQQQQIILNKIKEQLQAQLKKKEFWKISETRLFDLSYLIGLLEIFSGPIEERDDMFTHILGD